MSKRGLIGTGAAFLAAAALSLSPATLAAQSARPKEFQKPQVVDMGSYRVSAPPGKGWKVKEDKGSGEVTFEQIKGTGLLDALVPFPQERATLIKVTPTLLESWRWGMSEEAAENALLNQVFPEDALSPVVDKNSVEKGDAVLKDKKVRFIKFQASFLDETQGQSLDVDVLIYVYFPSGFKKSHQAFVFVSQFARTSSLELFKNPGQGPVAAVTDSLEIVDPLKAVPGPDGDLLRAAAAGDLEAARQAIDKGAKAGAATSHETALSTAAYYGHREIVDLLVAQGAEINKADDETHSTPLIAAIAGGEPEVADFLVQRGADVNLRTKDGISALTSAVAIEHAGLVSLLMEHGADVNSKASDGGTPLMAAARIGATEIAQLLTAAGADVNIQRNDGKNALMLAIGRKNPEIARMLLDKNADVSLKTEDGWTALMIAAVRGDPDTLEALVNKGADVNLKAKDGRTALMMASEDGQAGSVRLLIEKGADVNAKTTKNQTALKLAKKNKHPDIANMLRAAGAKG